jgi:phage shock protein A
MIFGKLWRALKAQMNKVANFFWKADPIAQMQYEYDQAVEDLKTGKEGLAQYRALVERVSRQAEKSTKHVATLESKIRAYLKAGDRATAATLAVELQKAKSELEENQAQLDMHEKAYDNNLMKIKRASGKLATIKEKIHKYDAELKMSRAEAELSEIANDFNFDVTTDFGQIEEVMQEKIDKNRAKARVAVDLSDEGMEQIEAEVAMEKSMAEDALKQFESEMGLITPATASVADEEKELGPKAKETQTE